MPVVLSWLRSFLPAPLAVGRREIWLACAGAGLGPNGLAISAMFALRCLHPPGGAVALTAVLGGSAVNQLGYGFALWPVAANSCLMLLLALLFNNLMQRKRTRTAPADSLTVLHIGAEQTTVRSHQGTTMPVAATSLTLGIGAQKTAQQSFKHAPPSPCELENAIATVGDEVMRLRSQIAPGSRLVTSDAAMREIARLAGLAPAAQIELPVDAMPADAAFAATLLNLREFMQHLHFASITVQA